MQEYNKEPDWMQDSEFNCAWYRWQQGKISYKGFCDLIDKIEDVPQEVKDNHRRSQEMVVDEINKAIYIYRLLRETDAGLVEELLQGYDSNKRYGII